MSEHFNTDDRYPQTRAGVRALTDNERSAFMAECAVEPADFMGCLACYAYGVASGCTDEQMASMTAFDSDSASDDARLDSLVPERIEVTEEQFDAIMEILDRPPTTHPALVELLSRPSVFDVPVAED